MKVLAQFGPPALGRGIKSVAKNLVRWAAASPFLSNPRRRVAWCVSYAIESRSRVILSYEDPQQKPILDRIRAVKAETTMHLEDNEAYQLWVAVRAAKKIAGDLAEVGVFRGGSAKVIREADRTKVLHLFDTFEGIPTVKKIDEPAFYQGQFACSLAEVQNYLQKYEGIQYHQGIFPTTADGVKDRKFSFVHLDVDTYDSTLASLEFFYGRMNAGAILVSHDYVNHLGVRKAFDHFFQPKAEAIIEMSGTQCLVVKI